MKKIGFASKTYSIWELTTEDNLTTYTFNNNLSKKEDLALKKARGMGVNSLDIHKELYGMRKTFKKSTNPTGSCLEQQFNFGKHEGKSIEKCKDVLFMVWFLSHSNTNERKDIVVNRVCELDESYMIHNQELRTKADVEFELESARAIEYIKLQSSPFVVTPLSHIENCQILIQTKQGKVRVSCTNPVKCVSIKGVNCNIPLINGKGYVVKDKKCFIRVETIGSVLTITGLSLGSTPEEALEDFYALDVSNMSDRFYRAARRVKLELDNISLDMDVVVHDAIECDWTDNEICDWVTGQVADIESKQRSVVDYDKARGIINEVLDELCVVGGHLYNMDNEVSYVAEKRMNKEDYTNHILDLLEVGYMIDTTKNPKFVQYREDSIGYLAKKEYNESRYDKSDWEKYILHCAEKQLDMYTFTAMIDGYEVQFIQKIPVVDSL